MKRFLIFLFFLISLLVPSSILAADISTTDKLITVDISKQMLYAWEGGKIQYQTKVSTGMRLTPTVKGSFRIWSKIPLQDMRGPSPYKNLYPKGKYLIKNVPNIMYFYQGYAIHGTYWHHSFGRVASHGCVNVPLEAASWLFNWANPGTRVEVF